MESYLVLGKIHNGPFSTWFSLEEEEGNNLESVSFLNNKLNALNDKLIYKMFQFYFKVMIFPTICTWTF